MFHFVEEFRPAFAKLVDLYDSGKLKCNLDFGQASPTGVFKGLDSIADAVEVKKSNTLGTLSLAGKNVLLL